MAVIRVIYDLYSFVGLRIFKIPGINFRSALQQMFKELNSLSPDADIEDKMEILSLLARIDSNWAKMLLAIMSLNEVGGVGLGDANDELLVALDPAKIKGNLWSKLTPQIVEVLKQNVPVLRDAKKVIIEGPLLREFNRDSRLRSKTC